MRTQRAQHVSTFGVSNTLLIMITIQTLHQYAIATNHLAVECEERRDAEIEEGVQNIGTEYYPIESVEPCKMFKGVTQETEKFCFTYELNSNPTPEETEIDCRNTKQECQFFRQSFIDRSGNNIAEISECEQRKHLT